jgi:hypothetical protein
MPRKPKPKSDDPEEYKRFLETAKAAEAETDPKAFDKAFKRIARPKSSKKRKVVSA